MPSVLNIEQQRSRLRSRGICVIIPTYNNSKTICDVVTRAMHQCDDVIVVNDGCTDSTAALLACIEGITVVTSEQNKGKGNALKLGFRKALEMGFSYAITLDADGQHFPEDIPLLLEANIKHPGALLIGERKDLDKMERSKGSKFANKFSNFWFGVQTGQWLNDTQTGYRLYPLKKLVGLSLLTSRYEAELELMVLASWHGVELVPVPVNVFYPSREERVSHFRPGLDFTRISILNTVLCVLALVYALPIKILMWSSRIFISLYALSFFLTVTTVVLTPMTLFVRPFYRNKNSYAKLMRKMLEVTAKYVMIWHGIPRVKYTVGNKDAENFSKPSVIICNHQSHLDLMVMLSLTDKLIVLTNDWVWNSPFFGRVIKDAQYYPVSMGVEELLPKLQSMVDQGYSIVIYPEGTRSKDGKIGRFHKGAFYIAEQLKLDILPMVQYGANRILPKKGKYLRKGQIYLDILSRKKYSDYRVNLDLKSFAKACKEELSQRYQEITDRLDQDA